jgi:hypothetical protein
MVLATITMHTDQRPASAVCTRPGCPWAEEEASQSPDMQDLLRGRAVVHAKDCGCPVAISVTSVLTIATAARDDC